MFFIKHVGFYEKMAKKKELHPYDIQEGTPGVHPLLSRLSNDGKLIATAFTSGKIMIVELETGKGLLSINDYAGTIMSMSFSPDNKQIAIAVNLFDGTRGVRIVELANAFESHPLNISILNAEDMISNIKSVAYSKDGKELIVNYCSDIKSIELR
ncbi:MAG: hypothetical protein HQK52_23310 [Oligoflexia bacterium]|nr:hypothetical protein [Oligoflexia bacterium]